MRFYPFAYCSRFWEVALDVLHVEAIQDLRQLRMHLKVLAAAFNAA